MEVQVQDSLKYGAIYSPSRINRLRAVPTTGSGPYSPENNVIRVNLNDRALIRLSSLSAYMNVTISGLATGADYVNALIPYSPKLFSKITFYVNNIPVSGNLSNHHDILATALTKASVSSDWCSSRLQNGAKELYDTADDNDEAAKDLQAAPTSTTKTQFLVLDQILGLPNSNAANGVIDSSLFGQVSIEFTVNTKNCLTVFKGGNGNVSNVTFAINNFHVEYDSIVSVSDDYLKLMDLRLADKSRPINFPFQNYSTTIQQNSGSVRAMVSSNCVDMVVVAPLESGWAARTALESNKLNQVRYRFNSDRTLADAGTTRLSFTVGSEQYPRSEIDNTNKIYDYTQNSLAHNNQFSESMLYIGDTGLYARANFLSENCIWVQALSEQSEGWASKDRVLSGLNTNGANNEFVVNSTAFGPSGGFLLVAFLMSSVLQYDTATSQVKVIM